MYIVYRRPFVQCTDDRVETVQVVVCTTYRWPCVECTEACVYSYRWSCVHSTGGCVYSVHTAVCII